MKIQDVKDYLKENPQYFSEKNNTKIEDITSNKRYYFIADCGHEFDALPVNVVKEDGIHCSVCSGHKVVKGINDFNTIYPHLSKYLVNIEDGYTHTSKSNIKAKWRCPYCGHEWEQTFSKVALKFNVCSNCSLNRSYPEMFLSCVLDQLFEPYLIEKQFYWSDRKRYDFYLPEKSLIIEVHGKQHYGKAFPYDLARNSYEEKMNDDLKHNLATNNHIQNYVVIDASYSNPDWIKKEIMQSDLPLLLCFTTHDIDWDLCDRYSTRSIVYDVCQDYNNGTKVKELISKYDKSKNTIMSYLNRGTRLGWCNYDAKISLKQAHIENGKKIIENMSKPVLQIDIKTGEILNEFPSLQEAQRELKVTHIWDCIKGRRNTAGGYKWKYKKDICEPRDKFQRKETKNEIN